MAGAAEEFLRSRRAVSTRQTYQRGLRVVLTDPDAFLNLARADRTAAEKQLMSFIIHMRGRVSGSTLCLYIAIVRSFLDFEDVSLSWRRIRSVLPPRRIVADDTAPTIEEIRAAFQAADLRERMSIAIMLSSGVRVGALQGLRLGDVKPLDNGLALLTLYRGEPEQYVAIMSSEAYCLLEQYLEQRRRAGEKVNTDSPLLRDQWNQERGGGAIAVPLATGTVQSSLTRLWRNVGLDQEHRTFKRCHGFRKFFRTEASKAMSSDDVETLLGHKQSYYRPSLEHLVESYAKAETFLTISEGAQLRQQMAEQEAVNSSESVKLRLSYLELKDELRRQGDVIKRLSVVLDEMQAERTRELSVQSLRSEPLPPQSTAGADPRQVNVTVS